MFRIRLQAGLHFLLNGETYKILKIHSNNDIEVQDERFHNILIITRKQLIKYLSDGSLIFEQPSYYGKKANNEEKKYGSDFLDLTSDLKEKDLQYAKFKLEVIKPLLNIANRKRNDIELRVNKVNRGLLDPTFALNELGFSVLSKVSIPTVYRWLSKYENTNNDNNSLIPLNYRKGGKNQRRISSEALEIIDSSLDDLYLTEQQFTIEDIYLYVINKIAEYMKITGKIVQIPSYPTVARLINDIPEAEILLKRHGKRKSEEKFGYVGNGVEVNRILERSEMDHTELDIIIVNEADYEPIGRPTLTIATDKFSSSPLGFYIGFEKPSYSSVMQCLRHMFLDKSYVREKYPSVENEWDCYGVPEILVVDNGLEFHSKALEDACFQLGIGLHFAPSRKPQWKASIERYIKTITHGLVHKLPGTTRSNVNERGEEDGEKSACITMPLFLELVHKWIIDVYLQKKNKGVGGIPHLIWQHNSMIYPPSLPDSTKELPILLGNIDSRAIRNRGIELMGLFYNSYELNNLYRSFTKNNNGYDNRFKVKWDSLDISQLYVYDNIVNNEWIKVPCVDQKYTKGLTQWEHELNIRVAKKKFSSVDIIALARAHSYILEISSTLRNFTTLSDRSKIARLNGIGTTNEVLLKDKTNNSIGESSKKVDNNKFDNSHLETCENNVQKIVTMHSKKQNHPKKRKSKNQEVTHLNNNCFGEDEFFTTSNNDSGIKS